jgi:glycerol-3-phosphate cytidylyltransferase
MKLVFTCGVFDLFHEGHQNLLKEMSKRGDLTLAVVHDGFTTFTNKKKLPIEDLSKRTRNLIDSGMVDIIMHTYEKEPHRTFETVINRYGNKFDLLFVRGDDWKSFPGIETLQANLIPIEYIPYTKGVSSTKLRNEL